MTRTTAQDAVQFAGSTPFVGHHIQGHSVNVKLVREVPEEVLRTSVTHFGTRGLFGKPVRRTARHDNDNVKRKRWRTADSLRRKVKLELKDRGHRGASGDNAGAPPTNSDYPGPTNTAALGVTPPLPSPPSNIVTPSSLPVHASQTSVGLSYEESPSTATLPTTTSRGAFPTFANHHNHIPSPANRFEDAATSVHPSSPYNAPANMGDMYLDTRYSPPVSMFGEHSAIEPPLTIESIDRRHGADGSTNVPAFMRQGNSVVDIATWTETAYKILQDRLAVDAMVGTRIPEIVHNMGDVLHEKPSHSRDVFPRQYCVPAANGYFEYMRSLARQEREDWGTSLPPKAYSLFPSPAPALNRCPGANASRRVLAFPSNKPASDLIDGYSMDPIVGYMDAIALPNELIQSSGFPCASMTAPQNVLQTVPKLQPPRALDMNVNINTNTGYTYPQFVAGEAYYPQAFDGSSSLPIPPIDHFLARSQKTQRDNGAPSSYFHASPCTPSQG